RPIRPGSPGVEATDGVRHFAVRQVRDPHARAQQARGWLLERTAFMTAEIRREFPDVPLTLPEFVEPSRTALVLWDMQKGLAGKAPDVERIKVAAARLVAAADAAGVLVVWSRHVLPPLDLTVGPFLHFLMRKQKVDHPSKLAPFMQEGMEETEFLDGLSPAPHHLV